MTEPLQDNPTNVASGTGDAVIKGLLLVNLLVTGIVFFSNGYLWYLWQQDRDAQRITVLPHLEADALHTQVQVVTTDLERFKKTLEELASHVASDQAERSALREALRQIQEQQEARYRQIEKQLQEYAMKAIQHQQRSIPSPQAERRQNPVTW